MLKRTKLGETDVICTLLAENGSQIKAIAKGARKPSSPFTSRLELFAACDLLLARAKSLDIIKEARLVDGNAALRGAFELTQAASPMVELIGRATLDSLENPSLYPLTMKALHTLCSLDSPDRAITVCIAHLIKAVSFLGFKPQLHLCIGCDADMLNDTGLDTSEDSGSFVAFSFLEGGAVCSRCAHHFETVSIPSAVVLWAQSLLYSTFEELTSYDIDAVTQVSLLRFMQTWIKVHIGYSLRSLNFIISSAVKL